MKKTGCLPSGVALRSCRPSQLRLSEGYPYRPEDLSRGLRVLARPDTLSLAVAVPMFSGMENWDAWEAEIRGRLAELTTEHQPPEPAREHRWVRRLVRRWFGLPRA
jgi:hypothetical protein